VGPRRRIGLGDRREFLPRHRGPDRYDMGRPHPGQLGIAAVDAAAHAAHHGRDLLAGPESTVRVVAHDADTFDAADLGDVAPRAGAEVDLRVIEAECLDFDDDVAGERLWIGDPLRDKLLRSAVALSDDGTHVQAPGVWSRAVYETGI